MKAKSNRFGSITAFNGIEYVRYEWRDVPAGFEDEARRNQFLDVQESAPVETEPDPITEEHPVKRGRKEAK